MATSTEFRAAVSSSRADLHFIDDLRFELAASFRDVLLFQFGARFFGADAATGEKWKFQRELIGVSRNAIVEMCSLIEPETGEIQLRQALFAGRIRRQFGDALLRIQRANFRPRGQRLVEQRLSFRASGRS